MPSKYDAIVIGAGHNGLTAGFKFSVCSYVVSLLRPEIIRELQLASHGLEILPLDGTFTDDSPHEGRSGPQRNVGYQTLGA